jgi:Asp-tRNA(Asn)/Glu-tRNA(Gln) amidotransferase A subunit family amidase
VGAPPFRLDEPLPTRVGGRDVGHYYDVILTTYAFSLTGLPAISVPCGLTASGLPVGLQLVGHRHREDRVLALAAAYQGAFTERFRSPPPLDPSVIRPVSDALTMPGVPVAR